VPFNIVFTKSDKTTQTITARNVRLFVNKMKEDWEFIPQTFVTSAIKNHGKKQIHAFIEEMNDNFWNAPAE
jgi:GTP-binding protein